ncbi:hypothetical protein CBL_11976 [Carabus blaptoides fortunei]
MVIVDNQCWLRKDQVSGSELCSVDTGSGQGFLSWYTEAQIVTEFWQFLPREICPLDAHTKPRDVSTCKCDMITTTSQNFNLIGVSASAGPSLACRLVNIFVVVVMLCVRIHSGDPHVPDCAGRVTWPIRRYERFCLMRAPVTYRAKWWGRTL